MKECKYCRTKYEDNLSACPNCGGTKIVTLEEQEEEVALRQKEKENRANAVAVVETEQKMLISVVAGIAAIIIALIVLISYNANKPLSNGMTKDEGEAVLKEGIAFYDAEDYESAIECFAQLPSDSKQYEEAQSMLEKCEEEYSAIVIEKTNGYTDNGEYEIALSLLENSSSLLPDNKQIQNQYLKILSAYHDLICQTAILEADDYVEEEDYAAAIGVIDIALDTVGQNEELSAYKSKFVSLYKTVLFEKAKEAYHTNGYQSAVDILQTSRTVIGEDVEVSNMILEYNNCKPIYINTLDDVCLLSAKEDIAWDFYDEVSVESLNYEKFSNVLVPWGTATYDLNGEYELLSGIFVRQAGNPQLNIYCDGNLVYNVTLTSSSSTDEFKIDLAGVQTLTIEEIDCSGIWKVQHGMISEFCIIKNIMP